jgi:predicted dehydrogenase
MTEPLLAELDAFGRSCATGVAPLTDAWHGVAVVQVLEAIDQSTRKGGEPVGVGQ